MARSQGFIALTLFVSVSIVLIRSFLNSPVLGYGDFDAFPINPYLAIISQLSVWKPVNMGVIENLNVPYVVSALLSWVTGPKFGQLIFLMLVPTMACISCYLLTKRYFSSFGAALISSIIYVFNPVFLYQFTVGPYVLVSYAMLPLVLLLYLKVIEENDKRNALLLLVLLSITNLFDRYAILYEVPFLSIYAIISFANVRSLKKLFRHLLLLIVGILVTLVVGLPSYIIIFFQSANLLSGYTLLPGNLIPQIHYTYGGASILNILRLLANPSDVVQLYFEKFSLFPFAGFYIPILASLSIILKTNEVAKIIKYGSAATMVVFVSVIFFIHSGAFVSDVLAPFRYPTRLMFPLSLAFSLLIGLSFDRLGSCREERNKHVKRFSKNIRMKWLCTMLLIMTVLSMVAFNGKALDGSVTLYNIYGKSNVSMPPQVQSALQSLMSMINGVEPFRVLWLPTDFYTFKFVTPSYPYLFAAWPGSEQWNYPNISLIGNVFEVVAGNYTNRLGQILAPFSVRYIVVTNSTYSGPIKTVTLFARSKGIIGSQQSFIQLLNKQQDLKLIEQGNGFYIYENTVFIPRINVFEKSVLVYNDSGNEFYTTMNALYKVLGSDITRYMLIFARDVPTDELQRVESYVNEAVYLNGSEVKIIFMRNYTECTWIYLSESFSSVWTLSNSLLHVKAFSFGNAFCSSSGDRGQITNRLQWIYTASVLGSVLSIIVLSFWWVDLTISRDIRLAKDTKARFVSGHVRSVSEKPAFWLAK